MEITDKELLAICNLSNLKMEFANIVKSIKTEGEKKIYTNHTIYSLLDKEYKSINNQGKNNDRLDIYYYNYYFTFYCNINIFKEI